MTLDSHPQSLAEDVSPEGKPKRSNWTDCGQREEQDGEDAGMIYQSTQQREDYQGKNTAVAVAVAVLDDVNLAPQRPTYILDG
jgi:hypothetical protein